MNLKGLQNRAGELMKECDELMEKSRAARKRESDAKAAFEANKHALENLQARMYVDFMEDPNQDWEHPAPVLDAAGQPMPEYEVQWRSMKMNTLIQRDEGFQALDQAMSQAEVDFYGAQNEAVQLATELGVKKAEMSLIAALVRLAGEDG